MTYGVMNTDEMNALGMELMEKTAKLAELRQAVTPQPVEDVELQGPDGPVMLSELFGDKSDLILVHNMGKSCPYCTLWADGLNGQRAYLEDRAAFVVSSPDAPDVQAEFAASRGWGFRMVSVRGTTFAHDSGFAEDKDGATNWMPGVTTLARDDDGAITRIAQSPFGPGDPFCALWHLTDMLKGGTGDWQPAHHMPA